MGYLKTIARRSAVFILCGVAVGVTNGCHDTAEPGQPGPPDPGPNPDDVAVAGKIRVEYACGNNFTAINGNVSQVAVVYKVRSSTEQDTLALPEAPSGDPGFSETTFATAATGMVELYYKGILTGTAENGAVTCASPPPPPPPPPPVPEATLGRWEPVLSWPIIAVHMHLLPDGTVLIWGHYDRTPRVWNPLTGAFTSRPISSWLFCSGHTLLADGRLLVVGGHDMVNGRGLPDVNLYSAQGQTWTSLDTMVNGRWYPTATTLGNGDVLAIGGTSRTGDTVFVPEVWREGAGWRSLTDASRGLPYYPRTFVAPTGPVFYAGEAQATGYLRTSGTGSWTFVANRTVKDRSYGSAVMYRPGKILYMGGGAPTNTAELIDLNAAAPAWRRTGSMRYARRQLNATILADGKVLVTGGTSAPGYNNEAGAVFAAEVWDPGTGTWSTLASARVIRVYHSSAVLLPDGRVLTGGSGDGGGSTDQYSAEIFTPPSLFKSDGTLATRPTITGAPTSIGYSQTFSVQTPDAANVGRVTLIRLSSTTHAFNQSQRFNNLTIVSRTTGSVMVTAPANGDLAPPGPYLLFIHANGVPSIAKIVTLR